MKIPKTILDQFYEGKATEQTKFGVNASISILAGPHSGKVGSVISIEALEPQPRYLVELNDGMDIQIEESNLAPL